MLGDGEAILEPDGRAVVQAEEVACLLAETAVAQIPLEPVREMKVRLVQRQPQRGGQIDQREVGLGGLRSRVIVDSCRPGGLGQST